MKIRHDYTINEIQDLYDLSLMKLISKAHQIHIQFHDPSKIQMCHCISIKTGGCPEDCKYCAQSSRYQTSVSAQPMMIFEEVIENAKKAIKKGASRICLVAAWREVRDSKQFEEVLRMTKEVTALGVEVCCCLGMIKEEQAKKLKEAGAFAYSHNLDTSENFYKQIITTRTYQDRLDTLEAIEKAGISVCCGGILGMGESVEDRLELLRTLSSRDPHPDSVPINRLSAVPGTPLENQKTVSYWELLRIIAIARIIMPKVIVRLSSGRQHMSHEEQALCFFAGANSIHFGEKFLTVANKPMDQEEELFQLLGLQKMASK
jgi:biotin synthase